MANGIYIICCIKTNRVYIGETRNTIPRLSKHKAQLKLNIHFTKKLQEDWNKYGELHFVFKVIESNPKFTKQERFLREEYWIKFYKNDPDFEVCNIRYGDVYVSEEAKKRCSRILSEKMSGEKHPMWGKQGYWKFKKRPKEFSNKISESLKGHFVSIETRKKQSEAKLGKDPHNKFPITPELLEDIKNNISYKAFEEKYGKSKNTLKRIKRELKGEKRIRIRHPELRQES